MRNSKIAQLQRFMEIRNLPTNRQDRMTQINLYRYDGFPIDIEGWISERNRQADVFEEANKRELTKEDLEQFQKDSQELDSKYSTTTTIDFPTTTQEQQSLNIKFGDILYCNNDSGSLIAVVMTPSQFFLDKYELERQKQLHPDMKPLDKLIEDIQSRKSGSIHQSTITKSDI